MFSEHVLNTGNAEGSKASHHPFSFAPDLVVVNKVCRQKQTNGNISCCALCRKQSLEKENRKITFGFNHMETTNALYIFQDWL